MNASPHFKNSLAIEVIRWSNHLNDGVTGVDTAT